MGIFRILGIGICAWTASLVMQAFGKKEMAIICQIAGGCVLVGMVAKPLADMLETMVNYAKDGSVTDEFARTMIKTVSVALLTEWMAQLCRDAGAGVLAQKTVFAGKVVILCTVLPLLTDLFDTALQLLP